MVCIHCMSHMAFVGHRESHKQNTLVIQNALFCSEEAENAMPEVCL